MSPWASTFPAFQVFSVMQSAAKVYDVFDYIQTMYLPAVLVASLALLFTVSSFWWLNARTGRLIFYSVMTFAGHINAHALVLQIPVVVHNTGAKPRVIRALRLQGMDQSNIIFRLAAQTFETKLTPGNDDTDFVHAFAIDGRSVVTKYVKFSTTAVPLLEPGKPIKLVLQGLVDEGVGWVGLKTLDVHIGTLTGSFLTMSNNPDHWHPETLANGRKHQEAVMERVLEHRKKISA